MPKGSTASSQGPAPLNGNPQRWERRWDPKGPAVQGGDPTAHGVWDPLSCERTSLSARGAGGLLANLKAGNLKS
jgi:hypothetical protein